MADDQPVELVLTCGSWQEAQRIVDKLLADKLIACAEFIPIKSKFSWKHKLEEADEIKLIMLSKADFFQPVEKVVTKLHSYETFVLKAIPVLHLSHMAKAWLKDSTTN